MKKKRVMGSSAAAIALIGVLTLGTVTPAFAWQGAWRSATGPSVAVCQARAIITITVMRANGWRTTHYTQKNCVLEGDGQYHWSARFDKK